MYCENCGERLDDDTKFCEYCGAKVSHSSEDEAAPVKVTIPEEPSFTTENPEKKNKPSGLTVTMICFVAVLAVTAVVLGFRILGESDGTEKSSRTKKPDPPEEILAEGRESSEEALEETITEPQAESIPVVAETAKESEKPSEPVAESIPEETEPEKLQLEGGLADLPRDLYSEDDFIIATRPDGAYSFMYPTDYFYEAVYEAGMCRRQIHEEIRKYACENIDISITMMPVVAYIAGGL